MPEDPVAVRVQGDGYAVTLQKTTYQQEVAAGVLLLAEDSVNHCTGGIVHGDQQREGRRLSPNHG